MAKPTSMTTFSGTLDGLSSYTIEGRKGHYLRRKGGASREKILNDPCFANTRRNLTEISGRGPATHYVFEAIRPFQTGQGTTGTINHLLSVIQKMDSHSIWGRWTVALSVCPGLLRSLNISRRLLFDNIVPTGLPGELSRETLSGIVEIMALLPSVNCTHSKGYPFFRVVAVLGLVSDLFYVDSLKEFRPEEGFTTLLPQKAETAWFQTNAASPAITLELGLQGVPEVNSFSLLLSAGIEYGRLGITGAVEPVPKAVASKILAAV